MTTATQGVERLRRAADDGRLDALAARLGIRLLGVFGSAAHPRPGHAAADLDVAVSFRDAPKELALVDALVEITGVDEIDLAVIDGADPVLRADALVGIPLYEDETGAYANEQMAALAVRRDTEWLRDLDRRLLAG